MMSRGVKVYYRQKKKSFFRIFTNNFLVKICSFIYLVIYLFQIQLQPHLSGFSRPPQISLRNNEYFFLPLLTALVRSCHGRSPVHMFYSGTSFTPDAGPDATLSIFRAWDRHWKCTGSCSPPVVGVGSLTGNGTQATVVSAPHASH